MSQARLIVLVAVTALAGCGAGQSVPGTHRDAASKTRVALRITIPHASAPNQVGRRPAYVSPATQSATVDVTPQGSTTPVGGYPQTVGLTPSSTGCTSSLASTVCTLTLSVGAGSYALTLTTYDGANATGNVLSAAQSVPFTVLAGQANAVAVTLGGVPAGVAFLSGSAALTGSAQAGYQLAFGATAANLSVFGVDADGNVILGAGAPAVSVTSGSAQVGVSGPATASPNLVELASNGQSAPVTLTATVTPAATSGANAVSATVVVSVPPAKTLYLVQLVGSSVYTYDQQGDQQALQFFCNGCGEAEGIAYDPVDQLVYVSTVQPSVNAYSAAGGALQPLSGGFPGLSVPQGIAYDSGNGLLYVVDDLAGTVRAYNEQGSQQTLSGTFPGLSFPEAIGYDPDNGLLYVSQDSAILAFDQNGNPQSTSGGFPNLTAAPTGITYDTGNRLLYVSNEGYQRNIGQFVNTVTAYDAQGDQQPLSGGFPNLYNPISIAYDAANGLIYVVNEYSINAYDAQGNQQTLSGTFPNLDAPEAIAAVP
ncbi:MAG TPA: hypothetical protein VMD91_13855 [Candidatus Sulfotelmatobacter sp.]|nr:hypothetical protein [Candidatus Sulfotelmatobacter sp.]